MKYHESYGIIAGPSRTSQRHYVMMETVGGLECLIEQYPRLVTLKPPHDHNPRRVRNGMCLKRRAGSAAFFQVTFVTTLTYVFLAGAAVLYVAVFARRASPRLLAYAVPVLIFFPLARELVDPRRHSPVSGHRLTSSGRGFVVHGVLEWDPGRA